MVKTKYSIVELAGSSRLVYNCAMKNITRLRKLKGWTQTDLAQVCKINQATVSKAEKGDGGVSLNTYRVISSALDVDLHVLFAPDLNHVELKILTIFRGLSEDRQKGWLDLLDGPFELPQKPDQ